MAATPEGKVKIKVREFLKAQGVWFFSPVSNGMGVHGIPDFICCAPVTITPDMVGMRVGLFAGVETKAPGKRSNTSAQQDIQIMGIHKAGGVAVVVDDVNQLVEIFKEQFDAN